MPASSRTHKNNTPCGSRTTDTAPLLHGHAIPPYTPRIATASHFPLPVPPPILPAYLRSSLSPPMVGTLTLSAPPQPWISPAISTECCSSLNISSSSTEAVDSTSCNFLTLRHGISHLDIVDSIHESQGLRVNGQNTATATSQYIMPLGMIQNTAERSIHPSLSGFQSSRSYPSDGRLDGD